MTSRDELKNAVREVLNEGTAFGQINWAGTSKETLRCTQSIVNILRGDVITRQINSMDDLKKILSEQDAKITLLQRQLDGIMAEIRAIASNRPTA